MPCNYLGFSKVYRELSERLGFDDDVFFDTLKKGIAAKKQIWRRLHEPSYKILDGEYKDYELGFEIQSPQPEFISWDENYVRLEQNSNVYFESSAYDQKLLKFSHPIRIGNIILYNFFAYFDNRRKDVAVLYFRTDCYDSSNSDKSYFEIKERFQKDFSRENQHLLYERNDQNYSSFDANEIDISLCYTYDDDTHFDGGSTSFVVENRREYPDLLMNAEYENEIELSDYILIDEIITTSSEYKKNSRIKRRPPELLPANVDTPIIWIDKKNSKIGFADRNYSQIFEQSEIISFTIVNVLPAKGPGKSCLEINLKDKTLGCTVFRGKSSVFNSYKDKIAKLTGFKVIMAPEYYDC